ncbi:VENN motif pre-toxin domain-containing protein [Neisseria lactamica]|uniref:VENN motif pre-toxin domain-containing protein n=1 Tax=Neisseria lactamica TaxID=486 RepID=UPI001EFC6479|nr:VENN motif pre-toxin domain-containing protein [Neisseria lactamica]
MGTAWEASGNFNQSKASGSSDSAAIQSGLFAGEGGYHIEADSIHLKGGAITSTAPKEQNELTAKRLTFENIQNQSSYSASNVSLSGSYGSDSPSETPDNADFRQTNLGKAFARSAGKNGTDFNPGLPQYEKGGDNSTTYATLSEGRLNIGGKKTTTQELGINSDSSNAHRAVAALPDLAKITEKQQIIAKATSDIVSAAHTFSSNRQKTAAKNKAKAESEFEGRLKAQNDGSYEAYAKLDETERQKILINYSETYRKADAEAQNWGVGGKHSRALNAGITLATGLLGGQSGLQSAVNAAAPYASEAIGRTFGHGENKNETAQAVGHFLLGAAITRVNGGNFAAGGSAAVAAEKAAEHLAQRYNDGKTAIDPQTGEFNANLLPEHIKEEIKSKSGVIASLTGAAVGGTPVDAQTGGAVGQNAVENNSVGMSYSAWEKDQALMKKNPAAYSQLQTERLQAIGFLIDFIPVIGDIKGFAEAETKGDYFFATLGIIPLYGDAARKVHQAEKAYQAAKAAKNTEKMKAAIDQARRNLGNIRSNVTGSDPLLAGAGNIRIPANGRDRIPDTALATTEHKYKGGAHSETKKPTNDGLDSHHCPAKDCYKGAPISSEQGPAIKMDPKDHRLTESYGRSPYAIQYRAKQKELLEQGKLKEAIEMDVRDIRSKFGSKYDKAIEEMLEYSRKLDPNSFKIKK